MLVHFFVILLFNFKKQNNEIYVVNLSQFQEFSFSKPPTSKPKKNFKEAPEKKTIKKPIVKKEVVKKIEELSSEKKEDILPLKKVEEKKLVKKKKVMLIKEETKVEEKAEEILRSNEQQPTKKSQNKFSIQKNKSKINNKLLSEYLTFISFEINKMASKSYPLQSIKRREQGTITSVLIINKEGKLLKIQIKEKAPKRLYNATVKIIEAFNFPKPPIEILNSEGYLKIKIPVNFILK